MIPALIINVQNKVLTPCVALVLKDRLRGVSLDVPLTWNASREVDCSVSSHESMMESVAVHLTAWSCLLQDPSPVRPSHIKDV